MQDDVLGDGGPFLTSRAEAFRDDPQRFYDAMRAHGPLWFDPAYDRSVVTTYEEAREALRHKAFGVDARRAADGSYARRIAGTGVFEGIGETAYEPPLVLLDDPAHRRIRLLMSKAFAAHTIDRERSRVERITDELLDDVAWLAAADPHGEVDVVAAFTSLLPTRVIAEMMGLDGAAPEDLRTWSEQVLWGYDPDRDAAGKERLREAYVSLGRSIRRTVAARREQPTDDLVSAMVLAQEDEDRLSDLEIASLCTQLMVAGNVTTSDLLSSGLDLLVQHPDQLALLRDDPTRIPDAVEEMLRIDPPITETARIVYDDATVGGCPVRRGDTLTVALAAANHDPARFADPHRFDVCRPAEGHLAFGSGVHVCLGAPLARLEAQVGLGAFLARFPQVGPGRRPGERRALPFFRGFESLRLRVV